MNAPLMTIAKRLFNQRTQPSVIDHDLFDPGRCEFFDMPLDQWFAGDGNQWLG